LPRAEARRKIPFAARCESAYRSLTVVSKTSDNKNSTAALGNSKESSVNHPPGNAIPDFGQRCENDSKVSSVGRGEEPNDVFKHDPSWLKLICDSGELKEQAGAVTGESGSLPGDAEILARESSAEQVNLATACGLDPSNVKVVPVVFTFDPFAFVFVVLIATTTGT